MDPLQMAYLWDIGLNLRQEQIDRAAEHRLGKQARPQNPPRHGQLRIAVRRVLSWSSRSPGVTRPAH